MKHTYPYGPKEPSEDIVMVWTALIAIGVIILAFYQL